MKRFAFTLALWLLCLGVFAQEAEQPKPPPSAGPEAVIEQYPKDARPGTLVVLDAAKSVGSGYRWLPLYGANPLSEDFYAVDTDGQKLYFAVPVKPNTVYVFVLSVAQADQSALQHHLVMVGEPGPNPDPDPDPNPDPIPVTGLHVLVVYESEDLDNITPWQAAIFTSKPVRDYLNSHCVNTDGGPQWRFLDKDVDVKDMTADWQAVFARAKGKELPWIIVASEKKSFEGKLPADATATLALLKQYGGN